MTLFKQDDLKRASMSAKIKIVGRAMNVAQLFWSLGLNVVRVGIMVNLHYIDLVSKLLLCLSRLSKKCLHEL